MSWEEKKPLGGQNAESCRDIHEAGVLTTAGPSVLSAFPSAEWVRDTREA